MTVSIHIHIYMTGESTLVVTVDESDEEVDFTRFIHMSR